MFCDWMDGNQIKGWSISREIKPWEEQGIAGLAHIFWISLSWILCVFDFDTVLKKVQW